MTLESTLWLGVGLLVALIVAVHMKWLRGRVSVARVVGVWVIGTVGWFAGFRMVFPGDDFSAVAAKAMYGWTLLLFLCLLTVPSELNPRRRVNFVGRMLGDRGGRDRGQG